MITKHTSTRTHEIHAPKLSHGNREQVLQLRPDGHVCLDEDGPCSSLCRSVVVWTGGSGGRVLVDQFLGLGPQREICYEHVAALGEEERGEAVVYSWAWLVLLFVVVGGCFVMVVEYGKGGAMAIVSEVTAGYAAGVILQ